MIRHRHTPFPYGLVDALGGRLAGKRWNVNLRERSSAENFSRELGEDPCLEALHIPAVWLDSIVAGVFLP